MLFHEEQIAYCGSGHPLHSSAGDVSIEECDEHAWVWRNYQLAEREIPHIPLKIGATCDNMEAVAVLILTGHYLGYARQTKRRTEIVGRLGHSAADV